LLRCAGKQRLFTREYRTSGPLDQETNPSPRYDAARLICGTHVLHTILDSNRDARFRKY
jgi:hypothetical protein